MTLPSSGPLSLQDIATEFGQSHPIPLSAYYAGGGIVTSGATGTNGAVPSSGAISIFNFYGVSAVIETQRITVGNYNDGVSNNLWGYDGGVTGSIAPGSSTIYAGSTWGQISWSNNDPFNNATPGSIALEVFNTSSYPPNSGWTTVLINGTAYARTSLTYSQISVPPYLIALWTQPTTSACPFTQTIGASNTVSFS